MIASLYQSGSSCAADGAVATASTVTFGVSVALATSHQPQNVSLTHARIETDVVPSAVPRVRRLVEEILDDERVRVDRHLDVIVLHMMRIEVDDRVNDVVSRAFAVRDDLGVVGRVEPQREIELQRPVLAADPIDAADELVDVARTIPVPLAILILLRVEVLLRPGPERASLAQLEAA